MSGNWPADELPCPLSPHDVSRYPVLSFVLDLILLLGFLMHILIDPFIDLLQKGKRFKLNIKVTHVKDLNFVLKSEIFVHTDG